MPRQKEYKVIAVAMFLVAVLSSADIYHDLVIEGAHLSHVIIEMSIILACVTSAIIFWRNSVNKLYKENFLLNTKIESLKADASHWKQESSDLLKGLGQAIDRQMEIWKLSESEKEVALLLLKGLSHKEISDIRGTSEKTIRQQSTQVYRKSSLDGRAQLSAFFLEDLLLPQIKPTTSPIPANSSSNIRSAESASPTKSISL